MKVKNKSDEVVKWSRDRKTVTIHGIKLKLNDPNDIRHPKKKFTFEEFFRQCDEIAKMNVFDDSVL